MTQNTYGSVSSTDGNPAEDSAQSVRQDQLAEPRKHVPRAALACLLLQHTSSSVANNLYQFTSYIFLVEVYEDTLAPASLNTLVAMFSTIIFSGAVGNLVDRTPRLRMVRCAVAVQKLLILASFSGFLILFGPMKGLPAKVFHSDSTWREKVLVDFMLALTILCGSLLRLVNVGIDVTVEKDWVTTISQGDPACLSMLNSRMVTINLLTLIAAPMVVSIFTMNLSYPDAAKSLSVLVLCCGFLELFWIQVVYARFPILREDEERRGRGKVKLAPSNTDYGRPSSGPDDDSQLSRHGEGWRAELSTWSEFAHMPVFFAALAAAICWFSTLHFDAMGTAHFKLAGRYSDFFLACMRGLCMVSSLLAANLMPRIEKRLGTGKTGVLGLGYGIVCFLLCTITFFPERPLERRGTKAMRTVNTVVMFATIILARSGHVTFDLAEVKAIQQGLEHHPRRNRMTALQTSMQAFFSCLKSISTIVFATQDAYKWTVLLTLIANGGAMISYLTFLRLARRDGFKQSGP